MNRPVGLREKHKADTRRNIQEAAAALFQERGFQATTMDMIAAAVDVSPRTLFRYFESKEDLLLSKVISSLDQIIDVLQKRPSEESCLQAFRQAVIEVLSQQNMILATVIANAVGDIGMERVTARLIANLRRWEEQIANVFWERLGVSPTAHTAKVAEANGEVFSNEYQLLMDKASKARLLASIGTTIFRSVLTERQNSFDTKDYSDWVKERLNVAFDFLESGCVI